MQMTPACSASIPKRGYVLSFSEGGHFTPQKQMEKYGADDGGDWWPLLVCIDAGQPTVETVYAGVVQAEFLAGRKGESTDSHAP